MSLSAISPIDGRYCEKVQNLTAYYSEYALIRYRLLVEVEYFIALSCLGIPQLPPLKESTCNQLRNIYKNFDLKQAQQIKDIEKIINHDVKAVEYFLKEQLDNLHLNALKEWIHFGLTSQDINNVAIPLLIKDSMLIYRQELKQLTDTLETLSQKWKNVAMLARTHGQPASPTLLGKELQVFYVRIEQQISLLDTLKFAAKFGGATGNYNAHVVAFPNINWKDFGTGFVEGVLGLHHSFPTTQIEHYDHLAALFDNLKRINNIVIDLDRDMWTYISLDYFKQTIKDGEVGSSAMPHKVNPIDFENSEGNLGVANAIFEHFSAKLPISRLQRDLTDSTVLRNIGVPMAHTLISFQSTVKGLNKLVLHSEHLTADLENNWVVVAEAIQTILRRENYPNPYEALKTLTRTHNVINQKTISDFIGTLEVSETVKSELKAINPFNYTGINPLQ